MIHQDRPEPASDVPHSAQHPPIVLRYPHGDCVPMCADLARNPSKLPSPADSVRPPPLRLRADGLPASEQLCLKAILDVLSGKLPRRWVVVDDVEADLYVHARGTRRSDGAVGSADLGAAVNSVRRRGGQGVMPWPPSLLPQ